MANSGVLNMKTLNDIAIKQSCIVKKIHGEGALKRRIMDMGITKDTIITVDMVAPLKDPMILRVRNYNLSLRKKDAEMIEVM